MKDRTADILGIVVGVTAATLLFLSFVGGLRGIFG